MGFIMISVRGLGMRLDSGGRPVAVLTDLSLDVPARQFVATAGAITVHGVEITRLGEDALARFRRDTIGYVFQSFHLIPTLSALENVAVPLELGGEADALQRAGALL